MAAFTESFYRLRQDCDRSQQRRQQLIDDIRADVAAKAQQTAAQLTAQSQQRRAEFTAMMASLKDTLGAQAARTRQQLADLAADLRKGGAVFHRG